MMENAKSGEPVPIVLDYRCKRCGAPFGREEVVQCTIELGERERRFHHCEDGGVGIGELVGFHNRAMAGEHCRSGLFHDASGS